MARGARGALGVGLWGGLTRDVHNLAHMSKFQMEISIIDSIKLPSVSISKICTYGAFPDISRNSLKPGDILKIINSNLLPSSTYVITCIERSHKGTYWCHEKSTLGRVVAWHHQTASYYLTHCKQVHDAIWRPYASKEFSIYLTLSTLNLLMAWYFQYFGYQQAWH